MHKQLFVLFVLVVLVLASGCTTTTTNTQPTVQPTTIPTPVPTTIQTTVPTTIPTTVPTTNPTPVPTTIPTNTVVGCWKLDTYKGDGKGTFLLELESGGTGWFTEISSTTNIRWNQDPATEVVNVSYVNPNNPIPNNPTVYDYIYMDFDYDETADTLTWLEHPGAPFTRVPC
jgi:hypothetical protein